MNQCRSEKVEPSTMHFRCLLEAGHGDDHHYFVPEDEDLVRKDRDTLVLQVELLRKENASLRDKKVGIPRLLEALASSPGAEERKALVDRIKELEAQVEELKLDIQKVIASDSSEIAEAKRLISEMSAMEIGGHKVGDIYDHMKKVANQKGGNPWAPNKDYPGKPV